MEDVKELLRAKVSKCQENLKKADQVDQKIKMLENDIQKLKLTKEYKSQQDKDAIKVRMEFIGAIWLLYCNLFSKIVLSKRSSNKKISFM